MRYVPVEKKEQARRLVDFESCGNISKTGSVRGMCSRFGWVPGGQVRLGGYIYNVGTSAVQKLKDARLIRG